MESTSEKAVWGNGGEDFVFVQYYLDIHKGGGRIEEVAKRMGVEKEEAELWAFSLKEWGVKLPEFRV